MYLGREPTQGELSTRNYSTMRADLIVVDESNSFSERARGERKYLTVVCSRTSEFDRFERLIDAAPSIKGVRKKYAHMRDTEVERIVREIEKFAESELIISEEHRYIHYPSLEDPDSKKRFYLSVLEMAVENSVNIDADRAMIIILDNPPLDVYDSLWAFGERLHRTYPNVVWFETRPSSGTKVLQSHDVITGLVADDVESRTGKGKAFARISRYLRR